MCVCVLKFKIYSTYKIHLVVGAWPWHVHNKYVIYSLLGSTVVHIPVKPVFADTVFPRAISTTVNVALN